MANDYFDFLSQNAQQDKPTDSTPQNDGTVNLTARADADCQVVCDGDFLFLLNANQIAKEKAPAGQHILQFISIEHPEISVEKIVDFPEVGKNYLVVVNELSKLIADSQVKPIKPEIPIAPVYKEKNAYVVICYETDATMTLIVEKAFLDENDAKAQLINYNNCGYEAIIKRIVIPIEWDSFYIAFSLNDMDVSSVVIQACSDNFNQILSQWNSMLKGKNDSLGEPFGPASDVSHMDIVDEREFVDEHFHRYFILKVSSVS